MCKHTLISAALISALGLAPLAGCENLPGKSKEQGAVIGGVGGALAGAAVSKKDRGLGALIGGVLGAGGGYLIGAQKDKLDEKKRDEALAAHQRAERNPARPEDVDKTRTADLNDDGFVTLDEVVAMERANLSDREMIDRLRRTGQVFELTDEQEKYLEDRGDMGQSSYARTASARERSASDRERDALRDSKKDQYRVRENDRPRDFEQVREAEKSGDVSSSERERF